MIKKKSKSKSKARPPRIFVRKNKLFIQVGKRKLLIKDAKAYNKADILNILLNQLLIRRKRRAKGKMTRKEKILNRKDLEIFQEFENLNRNQSKGTLKLPAKPDPKKKGLNFRDVLFYNAILHFMKLIPKKDVNVQVQEDIKKEKKKAKDTEEKKDTPAAPATDTAPAPAPVIPFIERVNSETPPPRFTDAQYERLQNELGYTKKELEVTRSIAFFAKDLLQFEKKVKNKTSKKRGMLKQWKEEVEKKYNKKINADKKTSFTDYVVRIAEAYPGAVDSKDFIKDYSKMRDKIFEVPEVKPPVVKEDVEEEKEEKEGKESEPSEPRRSDRIRELEERKKQEALDEQKDILESDDDEDLPELDPENDPRDLGPHASHFTEDENSEIGQAASAVLSQVANGMSYTGKGLTTNEIDNMMKPILGRMYLGALPADFNKFLPKKLNSNKFGFVMNTDPSNKEGKHWISVLIDLDNDLSVEYFDSFGREPPRKFMKEIKKLIDKLRPHSYLKFKTNRVQLQDKNTQNCGFFAMKFLIDRLKNNLSFKNATGYKNEIIDNSMEGENNIQSLKNKFGYI